MQNQNIGGNPSNISVRLVYISPDDANGILDKYRYHGQRNLRPMQVAAWARLSRLGRWETHEIRLCKIGEKGYLTDGQHRLNGIVMSGVGQWFVQVEKQCSDESEVARDYNASGNGAARTQADELRASGIEQNLGIISTDRHSYAAALKMIMTEFSHTPTKYLNYKDPIELQAKMWEHIRAHAAFRDAVRGGRTPFPKITKWAGVVALGLVTFETNQELADMFWRELVSEQTIYPAINDLQRQLILLMSKKATQNHTARVVAFGWNRWNKSPHARITRRNVQPVDEPIYIWGSSLYTGHQVLDTAQLGDK